MPPLSVMCLECKLRGEISYGVQQFDDTLARKAIGHLREAAQITQHERSVERLDLAASNMAGEYALRRAGPDIRVEQRKRSRSHHAQR